MTGARPSQRSTLTADEIDRYRSLSVDHRGPVYWEASNTTRVPYSGKLAPTRPRVKERRSSTRVLGIRASSNNNPMVGGPDPILVIHNPELNDHITGEIINYTKQYGVHFYIRTSVTHPVLSTSPLILCQVSDYFLHITKSSTCLWSTEVGRLSVDK